MSGYNEYKEACEKIEKLQKQNKILMEACELYSGGLRRLIPFDNGEKARQAIKEVKELRE